MIEFTYHFLKRSYGRYKNRKKTQAKKSLTNYIVTRINTLEKPFLYGLDEITMNNGRKKMEGNFLAKGTTFFLNY